MYFSDVQPLKKEGGNEELASYPYTKRNDSIFVFPVKLQFDSLQFGNNTVVAARLPNFPVAEVIFFANANVKDPAY